MQSAPANALVLKGHSLEHLRREGDAIATYGQVLHRFPINERPEIDKTVAWARTRYDVLKAKPGYRLGRRLRRLF